MSKSLQSQRSVKLFLKNFPILEKFNDPTIGFSCGLTFQYNFPKLISIRTNIAFERKGAIAKNQAIDEFGNQIGEVTIHTNFDYLTIPLLAKLTFGNKIKLEVKKKNCKFQIMYISLYKILNRYAYNNNIGF